MLNRRVTSVFVVALAVLAALGVSEILSVREFNRLEYAKLATRVELRGLLDDVGWYVEETGTYPEDMAVLTALVAKGASASAGKPRRDVEQYGKDGWGRSFHIEVRAIDRRRVVRLVSRGADGILGNRDDIVRWWPLAPQFLDDEIGLPTP